MTRYAFRTRVALTCFTAGRDTFEVVTIPAESFIDVPSMPATGVGFVGVRWRGRIVITHIVNLLEASEPIE